MAAVHADIVLADHAPVGAVIPGSLFFFFVFVSPPVVPTTLFFTPWVQICHVDRNGRETLDIM